MTTIGNNQFRIMLDERWPRIVRLETADGKQRLVGEREAFPPRLFTERGYPDQIGKVGQTLQRPGCRPGLDQGIRQRERPLNSVGTP